MDQNFGNSGISAAGPNAVHGPPNSGQGKFVLVKENTELRGKNVVGTSLGLESPSTVGPDFGPLGLESGSKQGSKQEFVGPKIVEKMGDFLGQKELFFGPISHGSKGSEACFNIEGPSSTQVGPINSGLSWLDFGSLVPREIRPSDLVSERLWRAANGDVSSLGEGDLVIVNKLQEYMAKVKGKSASVHEVCGFNTDAVSVPSNSSWQGRNLDGLVRPVRMDLGSGGDPEGECVGWSNVVVEEYGLVVHSFVVVAVEVDVVSIASSELFVLVFVSFGSVPLTFTLGFVAIYVWVF